LSKYLSFCAFKCFVSWQLLSKKTTLGSEFDVGKVRFRNSCVRGQDDCRFVRKRRHTLTSDTGSDPKNVARETITPHGRTMSCSLCVRRRPNLARTVLLPLSGFSGHTVSTIPSTGSSANPAFLSRSLSWNIAVPRSRYFVSIPT